MHYQRAVQALAALYSVNREYDTALAPCRNSRSLRGVNFAIFMFSLSINEEFYRKTR